MSLRTAYLTMTPDYPGEKLQEVSGYTEMRMTGKFILFIIDGENTEHLYFKRKYVLELVTVKGKM
ncbi:hypothetical protein [Sulfitobacter phage EE36phi1]|uniref:Uncharacterized protein n=1 Tax=Sulfitobacter phage EE36phi1 TaxID=490913 RepID=C4NTD2_9CAUD|nr:hypothetical protein EE36P1_gp49 [Sulfitobacter phage EE36phi1]ACL81398.1 hypothetical protein [Sulfitobacter phage EE36phi1]